VSRNNSANNKLWFRASQFSAFVRSAISIAPLVGLFAVGCGGGSGMQNPPPPPPPPTFATIDVAEAGTTSEQGTFALEINDDGVVAGYFIDPSGIIHGFVQNSAGEITIVDVPVNGNLGTEIDSIDASGDTAGFYFDSQDEEHSFVRAADGTITTFDPPNSSSGAQSINGGTVAGGYVDVNGAHGYLRGPDGTFTTFDPTGDPTQVRIVIPYAINASGAVAGAYIDSAEVHHSFFRDVNGSITILDAPGAGTAANEGTELVSMNTGDVIVGGINVGVVNGIGKTHCVIRAAGGTYSVFDPPQSGAQSSFTEAINEGGFVVGTYRDSNLVRHGFLRESDGTFVSFDDPQAAQLPLSSVNQGTVPLGINASGAVVGFYSDANGVRHGFTWQ